jgi:hypothetical protein
MSAVYSVQKETNGVVGATEIEPVYRFSRVLMFDIL